MQFHHIYNGNTDIRQDGLYIDSSPWNILTKNKACAANC